MGITESHTLSNAKPLDRYGRPLTDLRISVTDNCNFRCNYCMPKSQFSDSHRFLSKREKLTFDEMFRIARLASHLGVTKFRLTGGEPLLQADLSDLIAMLSTLPGVEDIALTTNGVLLSQYADALKKAGLKRVTISLDAVNAGLFKQLSGGRDMLDKVFAGINAAKLAGLNSIKINTVVQRSTNYNHVLEILDYFRHRDIEVRLIEFMDVGNCNQWTLDDVVPTAELRERIHQRWPLEIATRQNKHDVAERYSYLDGAGSIAFISSVSKPFCRDCSRARLSSDGNFYTCLFANKGTSLKQLLREGITDDALLSLLHATWTARQDRYSEQRAEHKIEIPLVEMHYIGG